MIIGHAIRSTIYFMYLSYSIVSSCKLVFESQSLDEFAFQRWRSMSWLERAPYLLDQHQIENLKNEYSSLCLEAGL